MGTSKYRLVIDLPREIVVGGELKISFTLYLDELPPLKHYSGYVSVTFTLLSEDGRTIARKSVNNHLQDYKVDYMYPGHRWGPYTITINPDYSISSSRALLYVTLESEEYVEDPVGIPVIATRPNPTTVPVGEIVLVQVFPLFETVALGLPVAVAVSILMYWRIKVRKRTV